MSTKKPPGTLHNEKVYKRTPQQFVPMVTRLADNFIRANRVPTSLSKDDLIAVGMKAVKHSLSKRNYETIPDAKFRLVVDTIVRTAISGFLRGRPKGTHSDTKVYKRHGEVFFKRTPQQFIPMLSRLADKYTKSGCVPRGLSKDDLIGEAMRAVMRCIYKPSYKTKPDNEFFPIVYTSAQREISCFLHKRGHDCLYSVEDYQELFEADDAEFLCGTTELERSEGNIGDLIAVVERALGKPLTRTEKNIATCVVSGEAQKYFYEERMKKEALKRKGMSVHVSQKGFPSLSEIAMASNCSVTAVSLFFIELRKCSGLQARLTTLARL